MMDYVQFETCLQTKKPCRLFPFIIWFYSIETLRENNYKFTNGSYRIAEQII